MLSFRQFFNNLSEAIQQLVKDDLDQIIKSPGETLVHFSNSEEFPPTSKSRGTMTAYNGEFAGSKIGKSITKAKDALFFWFLKDIYIPQTNTKKIAISGLFSNRTYLYLADLPTNQSEILRVSRYQESQFVRDITNLKNKGYDILETNLPLEIKDNLLDILEFGDNDQLRFERPQNKSPNFNDLMSSLFPEFGQVTLGGPKVTQLPSAVNTTKQAILILLAAKQNPDIQKQLVFQNNTPFSGNFIERYSEVKLKGGGIDEVKLSELLSGFQLDIPKTLKNLAKLSTTKRTSEGTKVSPEDYIKAMNAFLVHYNKKIGGQFDIDNPAWKLWLTVLFFSFDQNESWVSLWKELGYSVIIDDDPNTQIVPGLEKMVVNKLSQYGSEAERMLTRMDNEGTQIVVLDPKVLTNIRRFNLSELQPPEDD